MNNRPKIKLVMTNTDKFIEGFGYVMLFGIWCLAFFNFFDSSNFLISSYNDLGKTDRFIENSNVFLLPIISTVLFFGMTFLNKYPHTFNYPTIITESNALSQYANATKMIRIMKVIIVFVFGLILYCSIKHQDGTSLSLGLWFLPVTICLFTLPTLYFLIKSTNLKSED